MNERIKELAEQADPDYTGEYDDDMGHALVGNEAIQKFAELIVRECAELTCWRDYGMSAEQRVRLEVCQDIKKHFGVE